MWNRGIRQYTDRKCGLLSVSQYTDSKGRLLSVRQYTDSRGGYCQLDNILTVEVGIVCWAIY